MEGFGFVRKVENGVSLKLIVQLFGFIASIDSLKRDSGKQSQSQSWDKPFADFKPLEIRATGNGRVLRKQQEVTSFGSIVTQLDTKYVTPRIILNPGSIQDWTNNAAMWGFLGCFLV